MRGDEECDDANLIQTDGCINTCRLASCGDGIIHPGEECDDGNRNPVDGCTNDCTIPRCGDGVAQPNEECDDGNDSDTDGCTTACRRGFCGDGITWAGVEQCDDGDDDWSNGCTPTCLLGDRDTCADEAQCDFRGTQAVPGDVITLVGDEALPGNLGYWQEAAFFMSFCSSAPLRPRISGGILARSGFLYELLFWGLRPPHHPPRNLGGE